jgi:hypothetical protein
MSETTGTAGTLDTRADAGKGGRGVVSMWLDALSLADKEEKSWREDGDAIEEIYRDTRQGTTQGVQHRAQRKFNILYSNTETLAPALYNTAPIPDVRRRFRDADPVGKVAATLLERGLSYSIDNYDFSLCMDEAIKDALLPGRGIVRIRFEPEMAEDGTVASERISCETVDWRAFRRGPAKFWRNVPWVAFEHFLTREEFIRLSPKIGAKIDLDCSVSERGGLGTNKPEPDMMKRGRCWEIWDRETREVLFIAPAWDEGPVLAVEDPLGLRDFFPIPRPLVPVETTGNLIPVPIYKSYQGLAEDLEDVSRRIAALVRAMRWRGAYLDPNMGDFLSKFEDVEDGAMLPVDNPAAMAGGGLDKAFWFQPIEVLAQVLAGMYEARERIKQAIYEVTGISDIVRGASMASETATAQQIKAQWGSLRIQKMQREVQRFVRDLLRMKAEIIAEKFQPATIFAMAGMTIPSAAEMQMQAMQAQAQGQPPAERQPSAEEVIAFLRDNTLRDYRVDIETDSTIRADLTQEQQNIAQFVQGFGTFIQSIGPAVQEGFVPQKDAATLLKSFARSFKLGRDAEDAIESLGEQPPPQADPVQAQQAQAQAEQQAAQMKAQADMQAAQMKMQADQQIAQMKAQAEAEAEQMRQAAETQREEMRLAAEAERHRESLYADMEKARIAAYASVTIAREKPAPMGTMN